MDWSRLFFWWRPSPEVAELLAFAARRGLPVRDSGPYQIVGSQEGRWFTVTFQPGSPSILLVAVDAATPEEAVATRWTAPTVEHIRRLDVVIDEMCVLARQLETEHPEDPGEH